MNGVLSFVGYVRFLCVLFVFPGFLCFLSCCEVRLIIMLLFLTRGFFISRTFLPPLVQRFSVFVTKDRVCLLISSDCIADCNFDLFATCHPVFLYSVFFIFRFKKTWYLRATRVFNLVRCLFEDCRFARNYRVCQLRCITPCLMLLLLIWVSHVSLYFIQNSETSIKNNDCLSFASRSYQQVLGKSPTVMRMVLRLVRQDNQCPFVILCDEGKR